MGRQVCWTINMEQTKKLIPMAIVRSGRFPLMSTFCFGVLTSRLWEQIMITFQSEVQNDHCTPPSSCCPGSLEACQFSDAFGEGCVQKAMHYLNDKTGTIVGVWALVWLFMLFELFSIKHTVRRISLSKKWHEGKILKYI